MALEDFMEPEVGVAVAVTAAVASPQVRNVLRRGAVYGLAGILMAGDAVSSLAQGVKRGAQKASSEVTQAAAPETTAPEILSADGQVSPPEAPAPTDAAPVGPKRTRKAAEAADNG
jgi:hypothetical protein